MFYVTLDERDSILVFPSAGLPISFHKFVGQPGNAEFPFSAWTGQHFAFFASISMM